MTQPVENITNLVGKVGETADDLFESGEERQQVLSERHEADMLSDSILSKSIRPATLIFLMLCQTLIIAAEMMGRPVSEAIIIQVGTLLGGAFSFYFYSRRVEKVAAKNAIANIKMQEIRTKHELKQEKKNRRHERKMERKQ